MEKKYLILLIMSIIIIIIIILVTLTIIILMCKKQSNFLKLIKKEIIKIKRKKIGIDKKICYELMNEVRDIMNKHGIKFWLSEGTALGVFRDGDLISCDDDVDFSYPISYYDIFLSKVKPELESKGYEVGILAIFNNKRFNFAIKNDHFIDFDIVCPKSNCIAKNGRKCSELLPHLQEFYKIKFNNRIWNVPKESYYEYLYGKDWKTPLCGKKPPK